MRTTQIVNNNTHVAMISDTGMLAHDDVLSPDIAKDAGELSPPPFPHLNLHTMSVYLKSLV